MAEKKVYICSSCEKETDRTILGQCEECFKNRIGSRGPGCYPENGMAKGEILVTIHEMRGEYAHKMNEALMSIGKNAVERSLFAPLAVPRLEKGYYEAKAKVSVLDELLEKIAKTPEDTGNPKNNPFCNDIIRDAEGNEIARARG